MIICMSRNLTILISSGSFLIQIKFIVGEDNRLSSQPVCQPRVLCDGVRPLWRVLCALRRTVEQISERGEKL